MEFIDSPNEQVTIQLTTTIDGQGFQLTMKSYLWNPKAPDQQTTNVTAYNDSRLVIIKETGQSAGA